MKKEKQRILIACLFFVVFSGTIFIVSNFLNSSSKKHSKAILSLALREGSHADAIMKFLPEFEEKHNISCTVRQFSEKKLRDEIISDVVTNSGLYDLCMIDGSWSAEFIANNLLSNLSEYGYELDDDIIFETESICYDNSNLYLVPYYGNVSVLLYNKLIVREAGYQDENIGSLEDMLKICQEAKKRHNLGFMYRCDTENNIVVDFLPILLSYNAWVLDKDNNPTVDTPEWHKAMEMYLKLIETGRAASKKDLVDAISNKTAAMGIAWPGWYTPTRNSSIDYIALKGKVKNSSPQYNATIYGIWTLGIPSCSQNKKYAVELLKFIMDKENQKKSVLIGGIPCRYSSLTDPEVLRIFPQYDAVRNALETGVYRPQIKEWSEFYSILGKEMRLIINGKKTIDAGLADAQTKLEELMNSTRTSPLQE